MAVVAMATVAVAADRTDSWQLHQDASLAKLQRLTGDDGVVLDRWIRADIAHRADQGGVVGTIEIATEIWLRDHRTMRAVIEAYRHERPAFRQDVELEIIPTDGRKPRRIRGDELEWAAATAGGDGVIVTDARVAQATIPGLVLGDRLRRIERLTLRGFHGLPDLELISPLGPAPMTRVEITVPVDQRLVHQVLGPQTLCDCLATEAHADQGRTTVWTLEAERCPGLRSSRARLVLVPHAVANDQTTATFRGAADWTTAASGYLREIEPTLRPSPETVQEARMVIDGVSGTRERAHRLLEHVQSSIRYLGLFSDGGGIIPTAADETRRLGYGDCKAMSAYLIALCRAVELDAFPVLALVGTDRWLAPSVPNLSQFNHMLVLVRDGAGGHWLDPTQKGLAPGALHPETAASPVLVVHPETGSLVTIPREAWDPGRYRFEVTGRLETRQRLNVSVQLTIDGHERQMQAQRMAATADDDADVRALLLSPAMAATPHVEPGPHDPEAGSWRLELIGARGLQAAGPRLFLAGEIVPVPPLRWHRDPDVFTLDLRQLVGHSESWSIELPASWRLQVPPDMEVAGPGFRWTRTIRQVAQTLVLHRHIDWTADRVGEDEIDHFWQQLTTACEIERTPIILIKESS